MKVLPILICFIGIFVLSGCATHDYDTSAHGILSESEMQENYSIDREWWKQYHDANLDRLVELALQRNVDLARSAILVNKALYQAHQLKAELVPSFSGEGDASSQLHTSSGDSTRSFDASLGLNYELDLWGRLRNSASAQAWEYQATEEDKEATQLALVNSVVNTYFSMLRTRQELVLSHENLEFYERLCNLIGEQYSAGKIDGLDPSLAEQSLLEQRNAILTLEDQLKQEDQTLRDLLDLRPEDSLDVESADMLTLCIPSVDLDVPLSALGARPDVKAAEFRVKSGYRSYQATKEAMFPTITVGGTLGASSTSGSTLFSTPFLSGIVSLTLPFLDWNRIKWDVRISEEEFHDRRLAFQQTLTTALNEIALYLSKLHTAKLRFETTEQACAADQRVEAYRKARYELGADELKDWLDALQSLNNSRISLLNAKYDIVSGTNAVFQAMGGRIVRRN